MASFYGSGRGKGSLTSKSRDKAVTRLSGYRNLSRARSSTPLVRVSELHTPYRPGMTLNDIPHDVFFDESDKACLKDRDYQLLPTTPSSMSDRHRGSIFTIIIDTIT